MNSQNRGHCHYLLSLITDDNTYPIIDTIIIEIGKAFFETIFKAISLLKFQIHYQKQTQSTIILKRCIVYLTGCLSEGQIISKCNKIWMYLGEMFTRQQFERLHTFQTELIAILQVTSNEQPSLDQSAISTPHGSSMHSQDISMIETINLIEQESAPSPQKPSEACSNHIWQQIDQYLNKIKSYSSELNHLCQMMKLPPISKTVVRQERYYEIKCSISFECIYLNKKVIYLQGTSIHLYHQESLQSSCHKLLRKIYITVPQMWKDFIKLKQKKAIIT